MSGGHLASRRHDSWTHGGRALGSNGESNQYAVYHDNNVTCNYLLSKIILLGLYVAIWSMRTLHVHCN